MPPNTKQNSTRLRICDKCGGELESVLFSHPYTRAYMHVFNGGLDCPERLRMNRKCDDSCADTCPSTLYTQWLAMYRKGVYLPREGEATPFLHKTRSGDYSIASELADTISGASLVREGVKLPSDRAQALALQYQWAHEAGNYAERDNIMPIYD